MAQLKYSAKVLLILILIELAINLIAVVFANDNEASYPIVCVNFCDAHRPKGTSSGYTTTCKDVYGNKTKGIPRCKKLCERCIELCSNWQFRCPRLVESKPKWSTWEVVGWLFLAFLTMLSSIALFCALGTYCDRVARRSRRVHPSDGERRKDSNTSGSTSVISEAMNVE